MYSTMENKIPNRINLVDSWQVRYEELSWGSEMSATVLCKNEGWMETSLPCDIHMPLIENGIIKEPLEADNSFLCDWVEDKSWWFRNEFEAKEEILKEDSVELVIESLDSEADIFLNGMHLGHHRSAHYPFKIGVRDFLHTGRNVLLVRITSGLEYVNDQQLSSLKRMVSTESDGGRGGRGDKRRAFVRKPQYVYGWDWSPRVASCGIMKGAYLEAHTGLAVRGVHAVTKLKERTGKDAVIEIEVEVESFRPYSTMEGSVNVEVMFEGQKAASVQKNEILRSGLNFFNLSVTVQNAKFWWPNGMGGQPLYEIHVHAFAEGDKLDTYPAFNFGIRTLRLNLDKLNERERLFAIEINGVRAFCKGANWIPADSIYARVTDEKYDSLLHEAKRANFNMLRIWGGGLYERDTFYKKCDEYGILLWHDFMFSCSLYPDHLEWFRGDVENEMDYQTRRLRNHASMALWCGNNENQWLFKDWWKENQNTFPLGGLICYNEIAPKIVKRNCPNIPYWNSSPYGGAEPNDNEVGDRHHWGDCTMNPDMEKRITPEEYDKFESKFISEYGYIGPSRKSSILKYHGEARVEIKGSVWQLHNNTFEKETVPAGIAKHYGEPDNLDMDQYLLYAGLCQGLMLSYSLEAIRFKQNCSGALFWMYNDCWGEVGWTIIDYYLKRKISYYFVKRAFSPIKLIMREADDKIKVMGINDTADTVIFDAEYGYISFTGKKQDTKKISISLLPLSRTIVLQFEKEDYDFKRGVCFVKPELKARTGYMLPLPATLRKANFRDLDLPDAKLEITNFKLEKDFASFVVSSDNYAHAVHFDLDDTLKLSDEYFDLLPGESREVMIFNVSENFTKFEIKPNYVLKP